MACRYRAPIGLCPRCAYCRALACIQGTKLDAGPVDGPSHSAPECIDFPGQVSLADAADRRVAAHLTQRSDFLRNEQGPRTRARGSKGCFRTCMATANDDDIEGRIFAHCSKNDQLSGAPF